MNKKGFTQAEVLITLIVIGVISALTIPNIIQNTQDAQNKAAFKRIYSDLNQATKRIMQDNGGSLVRVFNGGNVTERFDGMRDKYLQYLNYVKKCSKSDVSYGTDASGNDYIISNCWSSYNYYLNKSLGTTAAARDSQAILTNGAFLDFAVHTVYCTATYVNTNDECGGINVDVNGQKGPNQYGKDIYYLYVTKDRLVPGGAESTEDYGDCDPNDSINYGWGWGCAGLVLQNKDY